MERGDRFLIGIVLEAIVVLLWKGDREQIFNLPDYRELKNEPLQVKH